MADVVATQRGYFGGVVREIGDRFAIPDDLMADDKRRPSWIAPAAFGGKGDHDNDGKIGGAKPAKGKRVKADEAVEPFADAPEPIEAKGNGVKETLGIEPDWIAPGSDI